MNTNITYKEYIDKYNVAGEEVKLQPSQYPDNFLGSMKKVVNGSFAGEFLMKSKYAVRGSLIGLVAGGIVAMYYKKSIFFYALIGTLGGIAIGHLVGVTLIKNSVIIPNTNASNNGKEVTQPAV